MGGMPYHVEKGQWFSVVEDYLNTASDETLLRMRAELRAGRPLWEFHYVAAETLSLGSTKNPLRVLDKRRDHMAVEWFGRERRSDGSYAEREADLAKAQQQTNRERARLLQTLRERRAAWQQKAGDGAADAAAARTALADACNAYGEADLIAKTGYWSGYFGDVEEIMRVSRIRAIEVALGLDPEPIPPPQAAWERAVEDVSRIEVKRRLPIEYYWKCPQRWFEAWVMWRYEPQTTSDGKVVHDGHVTVLLCTPGVGSPVLDRVGDAPRPAPPKEKRRRALPPARTTAATADRYNTRGMWVVSHRDHDVVRLDPIEPSSVGSLPTPATDPTAATPLGEWTIPHFGACFAGRDGIDTCEPPEKDGGVLPDGRPHLLDTFLDVYPDAAAGSRDELRTAGLR